MKVALIANDTTFIYNLRREILEALIAKGHAVTVIAQVLSHKEELTAMGCNVVDVTIGRRSSNPLGDLKLMWELLTLLRKSKPDVVLTNNIKPNIYGGMACRLLGIRYLPNITGLGTAVEIPGKLQMLTTRLYKWGVAGAECVFFQNSENEQFFRERKMLNKKSRAVLLPGSGVNLEKHQIKPYPQGDTIHFLYIARVMKEKGIDLYLACAKAIHDRYPNTLFHICGMCDDEAYLEILKRAETDGYIKYHGQQKDMVPFFTMAHCIVHPSYYPEGMSNVLLEAASSARPIVATDRSGCRETVDDWKTGFVVPIKDEAALIAAVDKFMQMTWDERREMGLAGRQKMEEEFDRRIVVKMVVDEI